MPWSANNPRFCKTCRRVHSHCLCGLLKRFSTELSITFLVDKREQKSSRNTSWLMHQSLQSSHWCLSIDELKDLGQSAILFLDDDALESNLFDKKLFNKKDNYTLEHLIIVDGTWSQARALRKQLSHIPSIKLSQTYQANNTRRQSVGENHLCTLEAVSAILLELEDQQSLFDYSQVLLNKYNELENTQTKLTHDKTANKTPPTK
jgi:DTW domain-containing protein YfiP